ncbi:hypothetical protein BVX97_06400 [bacterium E08(2017)]|nr:hypothetical protein BVX97_06400 [bacterium E08(2017)]
MRKINKCLLKPFITLLILATTCAAIAKTTDSIGSVIALKGNVKAIASSGQERQLSLKSEIFQNDRIITAQESKIQIMFDDNSIISQGEDGDMTIDEYVYAPTGAGKENAKCGMKFMKGVFRVVTGKITDLNPDRFEVKTRMATIGIRGCEVGATVRNAVEDIYVLGLPKGRKIVIERLDPSGGTSGFNFRGRTMEILKPGVVVNLQEGKRMSRKRISLNEARRIVNEATVDLTPPGLPGDDQLPGGDKMPGLPGDMDMPGFPGGEDGEPGFFPGDPEFFPGDPEFFPMDPFDPMNPFGPDMGFFPDMMDGMPLIHMTDMMDGMMDPEGHIKPYFDPDDPSTWPDYEGFDPNDPATWPDSAFHDPYFDPNDETTWPDYPGFDPDNPATWPQPPLYDPEDQTTWPDDPNFDPNDPATWPPPPEDNPDGGPGDGVPDGTTFHVYGQSDPISPTWEWGVWKDDATGDLIWADVYPRGGMGPLNPTDYANWAAQGTMYELTTSGDNICAAVIERAGYGQRVVTGTSYLTVRVGGGFNEWSGTFDANTDITDATSDFVWFNVNFGDSNIDPDGTLRFTGSAANTGFDARIFGFDEDDLTLTSHDIWGEMWGSGLPANPPADVVIGWFQFDGTSGNGDFRVNGAWASDMMQTVPSVP